MYFILCNKFIMDFHNKVVLTKNYAIQLKSGLFYTFIDCCKILSPSGVKHLSVVSDDFATLFFESPEFLYKHATFTFCVRNYALK